MSIRIHTIVAYLTAFLTVAAIHSYAGHLLLEPEGHLPIKQDAEAPASAHALKFDVSAIPKDAHIDLAELRITVDSDTMLGEWINVLAHPATSKWTPSSVAGTATVQTSDSLFTNNFVRTGEGKELEINVTELVKLWHSGKLTNAGWVLSGQGNTTKLFRGKDKGAGIEATLSVFFTLEVTE